ncbi:MAG: CPBP family intramembrane metalloprotease [Bacteroidetes bacterium]|nr:MAG: CPBP family intramembrane metalloprotease [Bacteroidota bacterium]
MPDNFPHSRSGSGALSPPRVLLLLAVTMLFFFLWGNFLSALVLKFNGIEPELLMQGEEEQVPRTLLRWVVLLSHGFGFLVPALFTAWLLARRGLPAWLHLHRRPGLTQALSAVAFVVVVFPIAQWALWLNQQVPLPAWADALEQNTTGLLSGLLRMESPVELLFNLLIIAALPALGEEFVFRGILQPQLERWTRRPLLALWLTAFLFSFFHFQFEGFLARLVLGAALGYLFLWTRNLWLPVLAHFANNGLQVLAAYALQDQLETFDPRQEVEVSYPLLAVCVVLVIALGRRLSEKAELPSPPDP